MFGKVQNTPLKVAALWKVFTAFNFTWKRFHYSCFIRTFWRFVEYLRLVTTSAKPIVTASQLKIHIVTLQTTFFKITSKSSFLSNNADFWLALIKEMQNKENINKKKEEIKELTNLYLRKMTGLRNLSKQEKTDYIKFSMKEKKHLFRI